VDWAVRRARRDRDDGRAPSRVADLARGDRRGASGEAVTAAELKEKLDRELAEDRAFLRKLAARARGRRVDEAAPRAAQLPPRRPDEQAQPGGPNPFLVLGVAFVAGVALAKWLDWRGHAHPRG
jgi:hypothetical protein